MKRMVCLFEYLRVRCYCKWFTFCVGSIHSLKLENYLNWYTIPQLACKLKTNKKKRIKMNIKNYKIFIPRDVIHRWKKYLLCLESLLFLNRYYSKWCLYATKITRDFQLSIPVHTTLNIFRWHLAYTWGDRISYSKSTKRIILSSCTDITLGGIRTVAGAEIHG